MRNMFRTMVFVAAVAAPMPALAWDYPGHRIVGAIADIVLAEHHKETYQRVRKLLEKPGPSGVEQRTLSQVAVFPDCAKDEEEYCGRKPTAEEIAYAGRNGDHKSFHYTNSPLGQKTYRPDGVGAGPTDVVHMIAYTVDQLRGKSPATKGVNLTDTEALWLLVHLVGDIHQPLHAGQAYYDKATCTTPINPNDPAEQGKEWVSTFGGNGIKFVLPPPAVPIIPGLHLYWDSTAVARAMMTDGYGEAEHAYAKLLASEAPANWRTDGDPAVWGEAWFAESMALAQRAYTRPDMRIVGKLGVHGCEWSLLLAESYEKWAQDRAREQLRLAGFRLAALLVAIFPN